MLIPHLANLDDTETNTIQIIYIVQNFLLY
jgi:hypothetical protein